MNPGPPWFLTTLQTKVNIKKGENIFLSLQCAPNDLFGKTPHTAQSDSERGKLRPLLKASHDVRERVRVYVSVTSLAASVKYVRLVAAARFLRHATTATSRS